MDGDKADTSAQQPVVNGDLDGGDAEDKALEIKEQTNPDSEIISENDNKENGENSEQEDNNKKTKESEISENMNSGDMNGGDSVNDGEEKKGSDAEENKLDASAESEKVNVPTDEGDCETDKTVEESVKDTAQTGEAMKDEQMEVEEKESDAVKSDTETSREDSKTTAKEENDGKEMEDNVKEMEDDGKEKKENDGKEMEDDGKEKKENDGKEMDSFGKEKNENDEKELEDDGKEKKENGGKEKEKKKDLTEDDEKGKDDQGQDGEETSPSKNLRKRKSIANGYKEDDTSSDEDYKDMILEKKPKPAATEKSVSVPVAALDATSTPMVPLAYSVGQPVSLVGANLLQNQQVQMVIPSAVSSNVLPKGSQPLLISQPQTSLLANQGLALNPTSVVLYPQLQTGSASAVMSNMLTTAAAQKGDNTKTSYGLSIVGVSSTKTAAARNASVVTSASTVNNKAVAKVDKIDLRPPSNSLEMIQLVKWELKQGVYNRPKNFRIKPDSELGPMAKFLRDFGQDLVKESVYSDLVNIQSRRSDHGKLTEKEKKDFEKLKSVHAELKEKIGPVKTFMNKRCKCGFKTESTNVMFFHNQHPHVDLKSNELKCGLCDFETKESSSFSFHMEAEHARKARYIEKPAFWPCSLCPYESNVHNKLTQHRFRCVKTFKLNLNLHPAWLPGPESNFCLEKIFYKNPVVANMNRLQQQQQQQPRPVMPIMPKGPMQQGTKQFVQSGKGVRPPHYNQMNKGPVNTQAIRNPTLMAKLGQNLQNQGRNTFPKANYVPNVNMFQGQKNTQLASHLMAGVRKPGVNVNFVRQPNTSVNTKINNIISMNNQVLDKGGQNNKPSGFEVCEICGGYVKDRTALRIHFFYAHRIDMPHGVFDRVHPPLYCATCFARFWTAQGLQKHLDVHKEDSSGGVAGKCIVCLHRVPNILMHMKIVHNKAFVNFLRECKCIFCGLKFPTKIVVENHMAAVHGVVVKSGAQPPSQAQVKKPVNIKTQKSGKNRNDLVKGSVCVLCNLNFGRNVDLTRHCMRVHHTCMKCGMVVADKESLMKHTCLESPSGLRNCEICKEKGFHPAYHVKHIRDKHLRKLSIRVKKLDRKTIARWIGTPSQPTKRPHIATETIELSDDEEPYAKRVKVNPKDKSEEIHKDGKTTDVTRKKSEDDVVMLTDDDDEHDKKTKDKPTDKKDAVQKSNEEAESKDDSKESKEDKEKLTDSKDKNNSQDQKSEDNDSGDKADNDKPAKSAECDKEIQDSKTACDKDV